MPKKHNIEYLIGEKFNRVTIIKDLGNPKQRRMVLITCECGKEKEVCLRNVVVGITQSCGCFRNEMASLVNTTHGLKKHKLYQVWRGMKRRCSDPNNKDYPRYGGRGVSVSLRWVNDFKAFFDWAIQSGWQPGLELDKDIRSGGRRGDLYAPETCCFVTRKKNCNHKGNNVFAEYNGVTKSIAEWGDEYRLKHSTILNRYNAGWPMGKILNQKVVIHNQWL